MLTKRERRENKAKKDVKQSKFSPVGTAEIREKPKVTVQSKYAMHMSFACPICLGVHEFHTYLMSTKRGIHQGLALCPECNNKFRFRTLTQPMTPAEYADYIFAQAKTGIWQKIPWDKWKQRLYKLRWSEDFWHRYQQLKAEDVDKEEVSEEREEQIKEDWEAYEQRYGGGQQ